jgi:hypothetical protein
MTNPDQPGNWSDPSESASTPAYGDPTAPTSPQGVGHSAPSEPPYASPYAPPYAPPADPYGVTQSPAGQPAPGQPVAPGYPSAPGQPVATGHPSAPGNAGEPTYAVRPSYPATPDYSTAPGYGVAPGYPAAPGQPGYPPTLGYPSQPGQPGQPGAPGYAGASGYPPNPGYPGHPVYGYPGAAGPPTNAMAIASLLCSLFGLFTCGISALVGAILGHVAKRQIRERHEGGAGMATAGVITGWIIFALWVLLGLFYVVVVGAAIWGAANNPDPYIS